MPSMASDNSTPPTPTPTATGTPAPASDAGLPAGIEIFKAGTHRDDSGRTHTFTPAMLAEIAATYNKALREAPLTVGHPKDNLPAYGWVAKVYVNAEGNLAIDPEQVDPAFAAMVRAGRFKKRSASFYPPNAPHNPTPGRWYLRHVGFLGAQPPAVPGLKDIKFSAADAEGAVEISFSEAAAVAAIPATQPRQEQTTMSDAEKAELERLRAELAAKNEELAKAQADAKAAKTQADEAQKQVQSYAEKAAAERRAGFASFAEAEIKAGRLLPKDKNTAIAALETLAAAEQPLSFSEGSTTTQVTAMQMCAWLQGQMSSRTAAVSFGEQAAGDLGAAAFDARGKSDADIDAAARKYQDAHPAVSYAEALDKVTSFAV